ncbi:MAG: NDP-sugar synthase [Deltaproteobacteria bacterium]|nr:NDP-sugar synthase [Deltaproteobacteria bacterium]
MKAMILCAGRGTRLLDHARDLPKPMLDVGGVPLLQHIIGHLAKHGFRDLIVNLHYLGDHIVNHFGNGSRLGVRITYSFEQELLGTAGALKKVESLLRDGPFLVQYGDILSDHDFTAMAESHAQSGAEATLLLHQRAKSNSFVTMDSERRVTRFLERPAVTPAPGREPHWVFSGACVLEPSVLGEIPSGRPSDLPAEVFQGLVARGVVRGFPLTGFRCAVDSPERLSQARQAVQERPWTPLTRA